jgi:hypothetical protein
VGPSRLRAATLAGISLVAVAVATFLAIFYAQELKRQDPLLKYACSALARFSTCVTVVSFQPSGPRAPHVNRAAHFRLRTSVNDTLVVSIVSERSGHTVRILPAVPMIAYEHRSLTWDGRTAQGTPAPPGRYRLAIHFVHANSTVKPILTLQLEGPPA